MRNASALFVYILLAATAAVPVAAAQETQAPPVPAPPLNDSDKPRVFITDSRSWEVGGSAGGATEFLQAVPEVAPGRKPPRSLRRSAKNARMW